MMPVYVRSQLVQAGGGARSVRAGHLVDWRASLKRADRACCCAGRPTVVVIMPPSGGRPAVDLLLCRHHYRVHGRALAAAGAVAVDRGGLPVSPESTARQRSRGRGR